MEVHTYLDQCYGGTHVPTSVLWRYTRTYITQDRAMEVHTYLHHTRPVLWRYTRTYITQDRAMEVHTYLHHTRPVLWRYTRTYITQDQCYGGKHVCTYITQDQCYGDMYTPCRHIIRRYTIYMYCIARIFMGY